VISLLVYVLAVVLFVLVLVATRLVGRFDRVMTTSREAIRLLRDGAQDDAFKERAARRAGLTLMRQGLLVGLMAALSLLAAGVPFWVADVLALAPLQATTAFALRWDVLIVTLLAGTLIWYLRHRRSTGVS
jgi:hypothetical protein